MTTRLDEAEAWLLEHDLDYKRTSRGWKHLIGGEYKCPRQEFPVGTGEDIQKLLEMKAAYPLRPVEWLTCERRRCGLEYVPNTPWQKFCSHACFNAEKQRRWRERQRNA